jgi:NH3-dependent NAD+ synthetase
MFLKPTEEVVEVLKNRARELGDGCEKVFIAGSGGADSTAVIATLCQEFGSENVVVMYRDIRSDPKHQADVEKLQLVLEFKLLAIDGNPLYDLFLKQCKEQFEVAGLDWQDELSPMADETGFTMAFGSLKSCLTTPMAAFISKAVDGGRGRIFGTGNAEEDGLLRYYDKRGDGAVDNNILDGLTKMEVRQMLMYFSQLYDSNIFESIALKTPSADLEACGDGQNDEDQLTSWARAMGYDIELSYGDCETEGNIAWALKEDLNRGIITGAGSKMPPAYLKTVYGYTDEQCQLIEFLRHMETSTRHKIEPIPGLPRTTLRVMGLVD